MRLEINNMGPLRHASIDLRPLTVLIGPNNSGKSFVAMVIYSALSRSGALAPIRLIRSKSHSPPPLGEAESVELQGLVLEILEAGQPPAYEDLPPMLCDQLSSRLPNSLLAFGHLFAGELARAAGAELAELRRFQKRRTNSSVQILSHRVPWALRVRVSGSGIDVGIDEPDPATAWQEIDKAAWRRLRGWIRVARAGGTLLLRELTSELTRACFTEFPPHARYLPAARSGLMQSHKALAGSIVRRSSWAGIEDVQIPTLPGVLADFLGEMIEMDGTKSGDFDQAAGSLERDLLEGSLRLAGDGGQAYPEVVYRSSQGEFPLGRTSSMISELAPVVLYLRHVLRRGDLLIVEEPEAHLHPGGQALLARHLVRLVNAGLNVTMTTHSEFFLQQLNNAIIASGVAKKRSESAGLSAADTIVPSNVAAYLFKPSERGTEVENLAVDTSQGIPESSFGEVAEYLYNQNVSLDRKSAINA